MTEPLLVPPDGQKRRCVREAGTQQRRQENRMRRVILAALIFCFCIAVVIVDKLQTSLYSAPWQDSDCWYRVLLERM